MTMRKWGNGETRKQKQGQIHTATITLGAFLKWAQVVSTGGDAKQRIERGLVRVNGVVETRRGRQLRDDDRVAVGSEVFVVRYGP